MPITVYEKFFEEELYQECIQTARHLLTLGQNLFGTNFHWNDDIVGDSAPVFIHAINVESDLHKKIKKVAEDKTGLLMNSYESIMFYYWTKHSYIPWHNDAAHEGGLSIYLNEKWDRNNGGLFLYEDSTDNQIKAIEPKRNSAMLQQGGIPHSTTAVTCADIRITIQVFFGKKEEKKKNKK